MHSSFICCLIASSQPQMCINEVIFFLMEMVRLSRYYRTNHVAAVTVPKYRPVATVGARAKLRCCNCWTTTTKLLLSNEIYRHTALPYGKQAHSGMVCYVSNGSTQYVMNQWYRYVRWGTTQLPLTIGVDQSQMEQNGMMNEIFILSFV
jgi:hypothetical protein